MIIKNAEINNGKPSLQCNHNKAKYVTVRSIMSFVDGGVDNNEICSELDITISDIEEAIAYEP